MIEQTFGLADIPRIFILAFLEILLSADNAIVLGAVTSHLSPPLRKKALYIGALSALVFRGLALLATAYLLESIFIQILGGIYLCYLSAKHLLKKSKNLEIHPVCSFWKTVFLIEALDLVFAVDSILAGVAFITGDLSKIWIVYVGGILGVIAVRYAAHFFASLMDRFPYLEKSAYLMIGWIGLELCLSPFPIHFPPPLFWAVTTLLFLLGFFYEKKVK